MSTMTAIETKTEPKPMDLPDATMAIVLTVRRFR